MLNKMVNVSDDMIQKMNVVHAKLIKMILNAKNVIITMYQMKKSIVFIVVALFLEINVQNVMM